MGSGSFQYYVAPVSGSKRMSSKRPPAIQIKAVKARLKAMPHRTARALAFCVLGAAVD